MTGTSSGAEKNVVVDIECSAECTDITAAGTNITPPNGSPEFVCANIASVNEVRPRADIMSSLTDQTFLLQLDFNCTAPSS